MTDNTPDTKQIDQNDNKSTQDQTSDYRSKETNGKEIFISEQSISLLISKLEQLVNSPRDKHIKYLNTISPFLMVIITIFLAFFGYQQWTIMNKSLEETKQMNADTKKLTEQTIKYAGAQTESAKLASDFAKSSADSSKRSALISELSYKAEARPYIWSGKTEVENFEVGKKPIIKILFVNYGKLPAIDVHMFTISGTDFNSTKEKLNKFPANAGTSSVLPPGDQNAGLADELPELTTALFDHLKKDNLQFYILSIVRYKGPTGSNYISRLCSQYDINSGRIYSCASHNSIE